MSCAQNRVPLIVLSSVDGLERLLLSQGRGKQKKKGHYARSTLFDPRYCYKKKHEQDLFDFISFRELCNTRFIVGNTDLYIPVATCLTSDSAIKISDRIARGACTD